MGAYYLNSILDLSTNAALSTRQKSKDVVAYPAFRALKTRMKAYGVSDISPPEPCMAKHQRVPRELDSMLY